MSEKWRTRVLYWALCMLPMFAMYFFAKHLGSLWFMLSLLSYIFIYRPLVDTQRLISLGKIEEKDAWRFFVPFYVDATRYFRSLWWG